MKSLREEKQASTTPHKRPHVVQASVADVRSESTRVAEILEELKSSLASRRGPHPDHASDPEVELIRKALDIIGSPKQVAKWMSSPVEALGGKTPYSLLGSQAGRKQVATALGRIEHGVY